MNTQFPIFHLEAKSNEQVMSPNDSDSNPRQPSAAYGDVDTDVEQLNVVSDPFELFEGSRLISGASEVHERASRTSDVSSERLDRLEGLIERMARQQSEFMVNQRRMQEQLSQQAVATPRPSSERSFNGSSAFTDFIKARDRRMRMGSLDEPMHAAAPKPPPRTPPPYPPPHPLRRLISRRNQWNNQRSSSILCRQYLDWPGFTKFSGKETYTGVGADFKAWGLRFLQRLGAAQQMSGGDWPEDFKLLALNGQLEGADLNYYEKMLPVWTSVSNTLEHVMNCMLMLYMTPIPATKGIEIMAFEKDRNRTWPEHYQFLVYVAERSGNTEQCVLECLCKSAPAYIQTAMLTRLNTQRQDHLQQASELVAFAIDFEISMRRQGNSGAFGSSGRGGRGRGGRIPNGGRRDQGGRGGGYIAQVSSVETRTCYACGE
ncbi:Hypothetical protein PHPALM_10061, partial [Phytophthora palmivora]